MIGEEKAEEREQFYKIVLYKKLTMSDSPAWYAFNVLHYN